MATNPDCMPSVSTLPIGILVGTSGYRRICAVPYYYEEGTLAVRRGHLYFYCFVKLYETTAVLLRIDSAVSWQEINQKWSTVIAKNINITFLAVDVAFDFSVEMICISTLYSFS